MTKNPPAQTNILNKQIVIDTQSILDKKTDIDKFSGRDKIFELMKTIHENLSINGEQAEYPETAELISRVDSKNRMNGSNLRKLICESIANIPTEWVFNSMKNIVTRFGDNPDEAKQINQLLDEYNDKCTETTGGRGSPKTIVEKLSIYDPQTEANQQDSNPRYARNSWLSTH